MSTTRTDRVAGPAAISDPSTDLEALEALAGTGLPARTGTNQWALRTITAPAAGIAVNFGDGAAGNPALALANDLAQLEGLAGTGIAVRTASDTWAQRSLAVSGTGLSVSNADGAAGNPTVTINPSQVVSAGGAPSAAAQSDQETATSTTTYVSPGRQQFHPSAAKCWGIATVSGGVPALQANFNVTSITDTATGKLTVTMTAGFSSANYAVIGAIEENVAGTGSLGMAVESGTRATGSFRLDSFTEAEAFTDPAAWHWGCFGEQ